MGWTTKKEVTWTENTKLYKMKQQAELTIIPIKPDNESSKTI